LRLAQGFHYSQPLPLGEFLEQLRRRGAEARLPVPGGVPA
jgi:sensor c-di-GMP phosphodiesterase-like protein